MPTRSPGHHIPLTPLFLVSLSGTLAGSVRVGPVSVSLITVAPGPSQVPSSLVRVC